MDSLAEKVTDIIQRRLRDGVADLETTEDGRLLGHIISASFEDMEFSDRRVMLSRIFDEELSQEERDRMQLFLTYTPEEWNVTL